MKSSQTWWILGVAVVAILIVLSSQGYFSKVLQAPPGTPTTGEAEWICGKTEHNVVTGEGTISRDIGKTIITWFDNPPDADCAAAAREWAQGRPSLIEELKEEAEGLAKSDCKYKRDERFPIPQCHPDQCPFNDDNDPSTPPQCSKVDVRLGCTEATAGDPSGYAKESRDEPKPSLYRTKWKCYLTIDAKSSGSADLGCTACISDP